MPLGVGGRDYIPTRYVITKEGSLYVAREGDQESHVPSNSLYSTVVNAAHDNLDEGGKILCLAKAYEVDALISLGGDNDYIKRLEFEAGAIITPKTDIDMFYVKQNGQIIDGNYDTTGIAFSKSVVKLGEGESYGNALASINKWLPEQTLLRGLIGKGGFGAGKGKFVYLHAEESDGMCFINTDKIYTYGFTNPLDVHVDHITGWAFITGCRFIDWTCYNPVIGIQFRAPQPPLALSTLMSNVVRGYQYQKGVDSTHGLKIDGKAHFIDGTLWDLEASLGIEFTKYSHYNRAVLMCPKTAVKDLGCNNEVILLGMDSTKAYKFLDEFFGTAILPCWTVISGTFTHTDGGTGQLKTGALINDVAQINWGGIRKFKVSSNIKAEVTYYPNRATDYMILIKLKEDATNYIYVLIDTALATARFGCVADGADTHIDFQPASWGGSLRYYINTSSSSVTLFENFVLIGEITTNIPDGFLEPDIDIETLTAAALRMYMQGIKIIRP